MKRRVPRVLSMPLEVVRRREVCWRKVSVLVERWDMVGFRRLSCAWRSLTGSCLAIVVGWVEESVRVGVSVAG